MPKLSIRLPEDDEHEPNPYDSRTNPKDLLKNRWLWWIGVLGVAVGLMLAEYFNGRLF